MSAHEKQEYTVSSKRETGKLGNASAAVTGLSTTKHPLNNSVINSPGRLRRPVPPPAQPLLSVYAPEALRRLQEYERKELVVLAAFILRHFYFLPLFTLPFSRSTRTHILLPALSLSLSLSLLSSHPPNFSTLGERALTNYVWLLRLEEINSLNFILQA